MAKMINKRAAEMQRESTHCSGELSKSITKEGLFELCSDEQRGVCQEALVKVGAFPTARSARTREGEQGVISVGEQRRRQ